MFFWDIFNKFPFEIYVVLFREPASQALSFYDYVNDRNVLPVWLKSDEEYGFKHIWRHTFRRNLTEWVNTKWVRETVSQMYLRQFIYRIQDDENDLTGALDVSKSIHGITKS